MKKSILKTLQPQTKSLFRFKNSDTRSKINRGDETVNTDATITTTIVVTLNPAAL